MTRAIILFLGLAVVGLCMTNAAIAGSEEDQKTEKEPFKRLTVDEVQKRLNNPDVHVYDGNNDDVYREGHIPGAVHLLSKDIHEGVLPTDKNTPLIFYCHNERWMECHRAARRAAELGYRDLYIMPEGIVGWTKAGKPVVTGDKPSR